MHALSRTDVPWPGPITFVFCAVLAVMGYKAWRGDLQMERGRPRYRERHGWVVAMFPGGVGGLLVMLMAGGDEVFRWHGRYPFWATLVIYTGALSLAIGVLYAAAYRLVGVPNWLRPPSQRDVGWRLEHEFGVDPDERAEAVLVSERRCPLQDGPRFTFDPPGGWRVDVGDAAVVATPPKDYGATITATLRRAKPDADVVALFAERLRQVAHTEDVSLADAWYEPDRRSVTIVLDRRTGSSVSNWYRWLLAPDGWAVEVHGFIPTLSGTDRRKIEASVKSLRFAP